MLTHPLLNGSWEQTLPARKRAVWALQDTVAALMPEAHEVWATAHRPYDTHILLFVSAQLANQEDIKALIDLAREYHQTDSEYHKQQERWYIRLRLPEM